MPIVSGFVVPKLNHASHVGNIRLLHPVVVAIVYQEDSQPENDKTNDKEHQEEVLNVMTEIHSDIFLEPVLSPSEFIGKHFIDFTKMLLHLSCHPLVFFAEPNHSKCLIAREIIQNAQ